MKIKSIFKSFIKEDVYLFGVFIFMAIAIIVKSYYSKSGFLTPDSLNYLNLAQNLLDGNGRNYYNHIYGKIDYFAIWPIGYSFLIFIVSKTLTLNVFWASKLLNILFVGLILFLFRTNHKKSAYLFGMILFFNSFINIFSYTWSESAFIFGLVWFSISVHKFIRTNNKIILLSSCLFLSSLFLFMIRYIGVFSIGIIFLLSFYFLFIEKNKRKFVITIIIAIINISIVAIYLFDNFVETGLITGMPRIPAPESVPTLLKYLIKSLINELNPIENYKYISKHKYILFILVCISVVFRKSLFKKNNLKISFKDNFGYILIFVGVSYLLFLTLLRIRTQFDLFSFRLVAPGSFLIFVGIVFYLNIKLSSVALKKMSQFIFLIVLFSFSENVIFKVKNETSTYQHTLNKLTDKYSKLEENSLIVFGDRQLNYLSNSYFTSKPLYHPYHPEKESWNDFIKKVSPRFEHIYVEFPNKLSEFNYHKSVVEFSKQHEPNTLVKIK